MKILSRRYIKTAILICLPVLAFGVGFLFIREYRIFKTFHTNLAQDIDSFKLIASSPEYFQSDVARELDLARVVHDSSEFATAVLGLSEEQKAFLEVKKTTSLEVSEIESIKKLFTETTVDVSTALTSTGFAQSKTLAELEVSQQRLAAKVLAGTETLEQVKNRTYLQESLRASALLQVEKIQQPLNLLGQIHASSNELIGFIRARKNKDAERQIIRLSNLFDSFKQLTSDLGSLDPKLEAQLSIAHALSNQRLVSAQAEVEQKFQEIEQINNNRFGFRILALFDL